MEANRAIGGRCMSSVKVPGASASATDGGGAKACSQVDGAQGSPAESCELLLQRVDGQAVRESVDVVLYDGHCRFCVRQIANLRRFDGGGRLRFVSLHDPRVAIDYPDLTMEQLMEEMWIVTRDGERLGGAYAIRYLTKRLPLLWPVYPWMRIPFSMPIWCWLYRQVAKRRYRIAGRDCQDGTCSLHG
jgi:predicted DCC family thiol-disulfide oxidoreductase YuxK